MALVLETLDGTPLEFIETVAGKRTSTLETGKLSISAMDFFGPEAKDYQILLSLYLRGDPQANEYRAQRVEFTVLPDNIIATMAYIDDTPLRGELLNPDDPMMILVKQDGKNFAIIAQNIAIPQI